MEPRANHRSIAFKLYLSLSLFLVIFFFFVVSLDELFRNLIADFALALFSSPPRVGMKPSRGSFSGARARSSRVFSMGCN